MLYKTWILSLNLFCKNMNIYQWLLFLLRFNNNNEEYRVLSYQTNKCSLQIVTRGNILGNHPASA